MSGISTIKEIRCNVRKLKPVTLKLNTAVKTLKVITESGLQELIQDHYLLRAFDRWSFLTLFFLEEGSFDGTGAQVNHLHSFSPEIIFNILASSGKNKVKKDENGYYSFKTINQKTDAAAEKETIQILRDMVFQTGSNESVAETVGSMLRNSTTDIIKHILTKAEYSTRGNAFQSNNNKLLLSGSITAKAEKAENQNGIDIRKNNEAGTQKQYHKKIYAISSLQKRYSYLMDLWEQKKQIGSMSRERTYTERQSFGRIYESRNTNSDPTVIFSGAGGQLLIENRAGNAYHNAYGPVQIGERIISNILNRYLNESYRGVEEQIYTNMGEEAATEAKVLERIEKSAYERQILLERFEHVGVSGQSGYKPGFKHGSSIFANLGKTIVEKISKQLINIISANHFSGSHSEHNAYFDAAGGSIIYKETEGSYQPNMVQGSDVQKITGAIKDGLSKMSTALRDRLQDAAAPGENRVNGTEARKGRILRQDKEIKNKAFHELTEVKSIEVLRNTVTESTDYKGNTTHKGNATHRGNATQEDKVLKAGPDLDAMVLPGSLTYKNEVLRTSGIESVRTAERIITNILGRYMRESLKEKHETFGSTEKYKMFANNAVTETIENISRLDGDNIFENSFESSMVVKPSLYKVKNWESKITGIIERYLKPGKKSDEGPDYPSTGTMINGSSIEFRNSVSHKVTKQEWFESNEMHASSIEYNNSSSIFLQNLGGRITKKIQQGIKNITSVALPQYAYVLADIFLSRMDGNNNIEQSSKNGEPSPKGVLLEKREGYLIKEQLLKRELASRKEVENGKSAINDTGSMNLFKKDADIEYYETVLSRSPAADVHAAEPSTAPLQRTIVKGSKLVERLMQNVLSFIVQNRFERHYFTKEKFESAVEKNFFLNQQSESAKQNNFVSSYSSFFKEMAEVGKAYKVQTPGSMIRNRLEHLSTEEKTTEQKSRYLPLIDTLGSSSTGTVAKKAISHILAGKRMQKANEDMQSGILKNAGVTRINKTQTVLADSESNAAILKRRETNLSELKLLQNNDHFVLSGKVSYEDKRAGAPEMIILTPPVTARDGMQGHTRDMPPITLKTEEPALKKQREPAPVKSLNTPLETQNMTIRQTISDVDLMSHTELTKLVDKVYSQLETRLARERRRYGY